MGGLESLAVTEVSLAGGQVVQCREGGTVKGGVFMAHEVVQTPLLERGWRKDSGNVAIASLS